MWGQIAAAVVGGYLDGRSQRKQTQMVAGLTEDQIRVRGAEERKTIAEEMRLQKEYEDMRRNERIGARRDFLGLARPTPPVTGATSAPPIGTTNEDIYSQPGRQ